MTTIKAVFMDIDSTMYDHSYHDIPESTKKAMMSLHEQGIKVGIATSRCRYELKNMPKFFREFPFDACISDGGALVMEHHAILSAKYIEHSQVRALLEYAKAHNVTIRYSTVDGNYFAFPAHQMDKDIFFRLYLNTPICKPYEDDDVLNILLYIKDEQEFSTIQELLPNTSIVNHGSVLEINQGNVDKSEGVAILSKHWSIAMEEIACIGDGANDVFFLKEAGVGIAMGNGCDEVKAVADLIAKRIDEDGVYEALHHIGCI